MLHYHLHWKTQQKSLIFFLRIQHFCCIIPPLYKKGGRDEIQ
nr:MAG TPA: Protealysin propeptide [Caudoviricetes sp.]